MALVAFQEYRATSAALQRAVNTWLFLFALEYDLYLVCGTIFQLEIIVNIKYNAGLGFLI